MCSLFIREHTAFIWVTVEFMAYHLGGVRVVPDNSLTDREEASFRVLRALDRHPQASQREIARDVRLSLGAVNYCLRALQTKGFVKVQNFVASDRKLRYIYVLTPQGVSHRIALAARFLARKVAEYERLKAEIDAVREELTR